MKRLMILPVIALLLFPSLLAINLEMEKLSSGEVMIAGVNQPAIFEYNIKNLEGETRLEFYNLLGFSMTPVEKIKFEAFEEKQVEIRIMPIDEFDHLGPYSLTYYIQDDKDEKLQRVLTFKRIELADALEVGSSSFDPDSSSIEVYVRNKENIELKKVKAIFSSTFFNVEQNFDLAPYEMQNFEIELNRDDFNKLMAGFYTMDVKIFVAEASADLSTNLEFTEKKDIKTESNDYGLIIRTNVIKKINEGNVASNERITLEKNMISRLFSSFSPEPDATDRRGTTVYYTWTKNLNPGESFEVTVKTNWLFPILLVILIIIIVILAKQYASTNLTIRKKVGFVRAKGGEFALKITIHARAKKYIEKVNIVDRLPSLVKIYEQFGSNRPSRVDEKARRIEWNFDKLEAGEIRVMSYIIYSKVGVMGKFSLPAARGIFERNGEIHETTSNRAFFISEPRGKDLEEE